MKSNALRKKTILLALLAALCLLVGTVLAVMPAANRKIDKENALNKTVLFSRYASGGSGDVTIYDAAGQQWQIDGCCVDDVLLAKLKKLPVNAGFEMWLRPSDRAVLQIRVAGQVLLDFDYAQEQLLTEAWVFAAMGLLLCGTGVYLIVILARKKW